MPHYTFNEYIQRQYSMYYLNVYNNANRTMPLSVTVVGAKSYMIITQLTNQPNYSYSMFPMTHETLQYKQYFKAAAAL